MHRGGSRNVEGGAGTVQGHRKQFCIGTGSRLDWLSYHLCALHALLTGRLSLSDVLELAILWALLTVTGMPQSSCESSFALLGEQTTSILT